MNWNIFDRWILPIVLIAFLAVNAYGVFNGAYNTCPKQEQVKR